MNNTNKQCVTLKACGVEVNGITTNSFASILQAEPSKTRQGNLRLVSANISYLSKIKDISNIAFTLYLSNADTR